ncbi:MAG: FAD-binding oxidoreductase [Firmicutes bacterium]|nr:FAD-binding oxidoreductase [Bacillota bacterium]
MSELMASLPPELKKVATDSHYERLAYTHDMSSLDGFLTSDWLKTLPDLVVLPRNVQQVAALLKWAAEHRVPVTPRGAGSTSLFQSVPAKGGVLLDLNCLNTIGPWNLERPSVQVGAGTIIYELQEEAKKRGLSLATFPSSAPVGTIGGWFNNGGRGYGSLQHGSLLNQVERLEVVLAGGEIVQCTHQSDPPIQWFFGSEGTLGVVTSLELKLEPKPTSEAHMAFGFSNIGELQRFLLKTIDGPFLPYNLTFVSATLGGQPIRRINWDAILPGTFLAVDFFGDADQVEQGVQRVRWLKLEHELHQLPKWQAEKFWADRFYNFRLQRTGPSLLGAETLMPLNKISSYVEGIGALATGSQKPMITFGYVTSRQEAYVTTMFWTDEARTVQYLLDLSLVNSIYRTAFKFGAKPLGIGLWNTPYLKYAYSASERRKIRERKERLDPSGIINPGKAHNPPVVLKPRLFGASMTALRIFRKILQRLGRVES